MTIQEIKSLISEKIAGQGSMVDIGGVLPDVLGGILENTLATPAAKVTVKIHPYKLNNNEDAFEPDSTGVSGTLYVKGFDAAGQTIPAHEIPFTGVEGENTIELSFDAKAGDTIGVTAKIPGKGASCQLVTKVIGDTNLEPEVYPAGIWEMAESYLAAVPGDDMYNGAAIITEDFAILWPTYQQKDFADSRAWGPLGQVIPFIVPIEDSVEAIKDFDGALNSTAILSAISGASAVEYASKPTPRAQYNATGFFLPSLGILNYLYDHRTEINNFIQNESNSYKPKEDYQLIPDGIFLWSSSLYDSAVSAWIFGFNGGNINRDSRSNNNQVCAVSAFQTLY